MTQANASRIFPNIRYHFYVYGVQVSLPASPASTLRLWWRHRPNQLHITCGLFRLLPPVDFSSQRYFVFRIRISVLNIFWVQ